MTESIFSKCRRLLYLGEVEKSLSEQKLEMSKELKCQAFEHAKISYDLVEEVSKLLNKHTLNPK